MEFFTRGEVAAITGLEKAVIKNWTTGRPLLITPSIKQAKGVGTRNYYSIEDIYLFAVAGALAKKGLPLDQVQAVIDKVRTEWSRSVYVEANLLIIDDREDWLDAELVPERLGLAQYLKDFTSEQDEIITVRYVINLKSLIRRIDENVKTLIGGSPAGPDKLHPEDVQS